MATQTDPSKPLPQETKETTIKQIKKTGINRNLLIWGLFGLGVLIYVSIKKTNTVVDFPLTNLGNGYFVADYQSKLTNPLKGVKDIATEIQNNRHQITKLDLLLGLNGLGFDHVTFLNSGISYLSKLTDLKISLSHNDIGDDGLMNTAQTIGKLPKLTNLFLGIDAMNFNTKQLKAALLAMGATPNIKSFTLSLIHNKIKDEGLQDVVEGLELMKQKINKLELILISNDFTEKSGKTFGEFLPTLDLVNSLYLSLYANKIGAEGASNLAQGLNKKNSKSSVPLKYLHLDLYFNNITDTGADSISKALGTMTSLETLKLNLEFNYIMNEGGTYVGEALKNLTQLTTLHLNVATKNFGTFGFEAITKGLYSLVNLEELYLTCGINKLGPSGIDDLKVLLPQLSKLKRFRLNYYENSLGDSNAHKVNEMFDALKNVEELDLNFNFNNLLEYGIGQIIKGAQKLPKLKILGLDVGQSEINDEEHKPIFDELDKLASSQTLEKIEFGFMNTAITPQVADDLALRYGNHPKINLIINSSVAKEYLEERKKMKERQQKEAADAELQKQKQEAAKQEVVI